MAEKISYLNMSYEDIKKKIDGKTTRDVLSGIDCISKVEKKNGFTYLSWAWAWSIVKKIYPSASYNVVQYEGKDYLFDSNLGYLVHTTVTIDGETLSMRLPVMDGSNKSQSFATQVYRVKEYKDKQRTGGYIEKEIEPASMFDINTAIMRCLVKNLGMFGLGLYIYAGEDLPEQIIEKKKLDNENIEKIKKSIKEGKLDYVKNYNSLILKLQDTYNISDEQKKIIEGLYTNIEEIVEEVK